MMKSVSKWEIVEYGAYFELKLKSGQLVRRRQLKNQSEGENRSATHEPTRSNRSVAHRLENREHYSPTWAIKSVIIQVIMAIRDLLKAWGVTPWPFDST